MNKFRVVLASVVALLAVTLFAGVAYAAGPSQSLGGTVDHSVYKAARSLDITGTINGDVYCAASSLTINATVNGDIICAGQTVNIDGTVNGSVRVVGEKVNVSAKISRSASIAGQTVVINDSATIGQDLSIAAQNLTQNGLISRDLSGDSSQATINGSVGRNVDLTVSQLNLGASSKINGSLTYTAPQPLSQSPGASVLGQVAYTAGKARTHTHISLLPLKIYWLIAMTLSAVILVAIFPKLYRKWTPSKQSAVWWSLLAGFLAMFVGPIIVLTALASIVLIPLAITIFLLWLASILFSISFSAYLVGKLVARKLHPVLIALIGGAILGVVELIPILGWIIGVIAYWVGSGIVLRGLASAISLAHTKDS